jgi:signal transduction histidine kinase
MLARRLHDDPRHMTILNEVVEAMHALETLVDGLRDYAADQPAHCEPVVLARLVAEIVESMRERTKKQQVTVEVSVPQTLTAEGDRRMLGTAVRNLAANALSTMPKGGQLVITAVTTPKGVELEVADSGPGLLENELARAFAPLRNVTNGVSGLELAIAEHVAAAHGGQATVRNCPEGGTALTLLIPHRRTQEAAA